MNACASFCWPSLSNILGAWTAAYVFLCLVIHTRHWRAAKAPASWPKAPARALVMRPCAGVEANLQESLLSGVALRAQAPQALVHLVSCGDAAQPAAHHAAVTLRTLGLAARVHMTDPLGINHKAGQLASYDGQLERYGVSVCIDSDVLLMPDTLAALCAPLIDPKCGAAWLPFIQTGTNRSLADRINGAVLATSMQGFGILRYLDDGHFAGKLVAIRPAALKEVGGWRAAEHTLGEDVALSQKLTAAGWRVTCGCATGLTLASGRSMRAVFERYSRWMMVLRRQRVCAFWTYPLVICPMPLLLCSWPMTWSGLDFGCVDWRVVFGMGAVVLARLSLSFLGCCQADRRFYLGIQSVDAVLADSLLLAAFVATSIRRSIVWRGRRVQCAGAWHQASVAPLSARKPTRQK